MKAWLTTWKLDISPKDYLGPFGGQLVIGWKATG